MKVKRIAVILCALLWTFANTTSAGTISVAKAGGFSCAIANDGPYCWGSNAFGALGTGTTNPAPTATPQPVAFSNPAGVTAISAGDSFACGIQDGGVYCWGLNNAGQLGQGTTDSQPHPFPLLIPSLSSGVTEIATGISHACAIQNGTAKCWGRNVEGQLGDGGLAGSTTPVDVVNIQPSEAPRHLTAGYFHTCVVKGTAGSMVCWGAVMQGELGTGGTQSSNVPVAVANMGSGVSATSAGYAHTCAVRFGKAFCWGNNNRGQLGNGSQSQFEVRPTEVAQMGKKTVASMTNGTYHGCLTTTTGNVFCWGSNEFGAIGLDSTIPFSANPVPIAFGTMTASSEVSAGALTSCAWAVFPLVEDDGDGAFCWGQGTSGQLGNGQFEHSRIPQRVVNIGLGNQVVDTQ